MFTSTEPSALDMMRSMYVALGDLTPTRCDAHFVHGAPAAEEHHYTRLLQTMAHHYRTRTVGAVVINGLSVDECKRQNQGYRGFEIYREILTGLGVPEQSLSSCHHRDIQQRSQAIFSTWRESEDGIIWSSPLFLIIN